MEIQIDETWKKIFESEFDKPYFQHLIAFVQQEYTTFPNQIFPPSHQIFRAFQLCKPTDLKVVILGQDPYPTKGHAHGLCFSCESSVAPLPKSLKNMFKELESDLGIHAPTTGDLSDWAKQGVLLLNSILTVREGKPLSHTNQGWEKFTDFVIQTLNAQFDQLIFVFWGASAQKKIAFIDERKHRIISGAHPSPLSAYKGFFGSKPYSTINRYLREMNRPEINWSTNLARDLFSPD